MIETWGYCEDIQDTGNDNEDENENNNDKGHRDGKVISALGPGIFARALTSSTVTTVTTKQGQGTVQVLHKPSGGEGESHSKAYFGLLGGGGVSQMLTAYIGMGSQANFGAAHPLLDMMCQHV